MISNLEPCRRARRLMPILATCLCLALTGACTASEKIAAPPEETPSTLITGALVVDGSGGPAYTADVRLEGGRVSEIGALAPRVGELVVDADGLALAPGFIDAHSHADEAIFEHPDALADVSQGITTVVVGQDGGSAFPLAEFLDRLTREPAAVNLASFVGHGTLRSRVLGSSFDRTASPTEIERMSELVEQEMQAGAIGLSSGLEYDPGIYSTTDEVIALARVAAAHGGIYISHIRSEDRNFWAAVEEILTIGREASLPVQISHIKLALRSLHGESARLLDRLDAARREGIDVTADIYPYTYWQSTLTVMFPDRDFEDLAAASFAVDELAAAEDMLIPRFVPEPALAGKTLAEIASERGTAPAQTLIDLIAQAEAMRRANEAAGRPAEDLESVIAVSMREADIEALLAWPHVMICTDGELDGAHPRGYGSFTRVLGRMVRERRILTLEQAVQRMSRAPAVRFGLSGRGAITIGAYADLVLFDRDTVIDRATTVDPHALSMGIDRVWVNGETVFAGGRASGRRPGTVLRREPIS
jgi:N-acyl-D-amino-acid deacylase